MSCAGLALLVTRSATGALSNQATRRGHEMDTTRVDVAALRARERVEGGASVVFVLTIATCAVLGRVVTRFGARPCRAPRDASR